MIEDPVALARLRKTLISSVASVTLFFTVLAIIAYFATHQPNGAGANAFAQAWNRWGTWFVIFAPLVFGLNISVAAWLVYWTNRLPPERFPIASYIFAASVTVICSTVGAIHAINNGLTAVGFAAICAIGGLMFGGAVATTFAAPRDAAKGACAGLLLGALTCVFHGWMLVQSGKPLWNREAWETRSICIPFCSLLGAIFCMRILRVKRFKRQLAGEEVGRLSK